MRRPHHTFIIFLVLIGVMTFPTKLLAQGGNELKIIAIANKQAHTLHEKPEGKPIKGVVYRLWKIDGELTREKATTLLKQLATRSVADLDRDYPDLPPKNTPPTDDTGIVVMKNLPAGYYYVRGVTQKQGVLDSDWKQAPFLVELPYTQPDGTQTNSVTVYPKATTEPEPPVPPDTPTGGEKFVKVSAFDEKALEGAVFKVVQRVVDEEGIEKKDNTGAYIYKSVEKNGKTIILKSGPDGRFEVTGLPYGVYYLIETIVPKGYLGLKEPLAFTIDKNSYEDTAIIKIRNQKGPDTLETPSEPETKSEPVPVKPPVKPPTPPKPGKPVKPGIQVPETGDITAFVAMITGTLFIVMGTYFYRDGKKASRKKGPVDSTNP